MAESVEFNALESNANAVMAVADTVRTTLGPKGLDKLLIDQAMHRHVSNDGVTILLSQEKDPQFDRFDFYSHATHSIPFR